MKNSLLLICSLVCLMNDIDAGEASWKKLRDLGRRRNNRMAEQSKPGKEAASTRRASWRSISATSSGSDRNSSSGLEQHFSERASVVYTNLTNLIRAGDPKKVEEFLSKTERIPSFDEVAAAEDKAQKGEENFVEIYRMIQKVRREKRARSRSPRQYRKK